MSHYFSRTIDASHSEAINRITALARKGFGILTSIDVSAIMKASSVSISGHTRYSARAIHISPGGVAGGRQDRKRCCNIVGSEVSPGGMEIAAVDPVASMSAIANPALDELAGTVRDALREAAQTA